MMPSAYILFSLCQIFQIGSENVCVSFVELLVSKDFATVHCT